MEDSEIHCNTGRPVTFPFISIVVEVESGWSDFGWTTVWSG